MKYFNLIFAVLFFTSCVSAKKYKKLESSLSKVQNELFAVELSKEECLANNKILDAELNKSRHDNQIKELTIRSLEKESKYKDEKMDDLRNENKVVSEMNTNLNKRNDDLTASTKVNADIVKKILEELELQNLKVLNLSLALEKQDSLNIHLVKRTKKNLSDKKLKKSLEKLGFVFY